MTGITITDPGSGYTAATVTITGGDGLATADAVVTASSAVTAVNVTAGGAGYTAPTVTFSGGGGVASTTTVGNPMVDRAYATDYVAPPAVIPAAVTQVANHTFLVTAGSATGGTFTLTVDADRRARPSPSNAASAAIEDSPARWRHGRRAPARGPSSFTAARPASSRSTAPALTQGVADASAAVGRDDQRLERQRRQRLWRQLHARRR